MERMADADFLRLAAPDTNLEAPLVLPCSAVFCRVLPCPAVACHVLPWPAVASRANPVQIIASLFGMISGGVLLCCFQRNIYLCTPIIFIIAAVFDLVAAIMW